MRFVKRLIILSGQGGKGTLGLEKNAYGIFAKLSAYGRPLVAADVVLRIDGKFFCHSLTGSRDNFSLGETDSMDVIHAAVFSGGELLMYGTNDAKRLDKAEVQAFARQKQCKRIGAGLFSGRKPIDGIGASGGDGRTAMQIEGQTKDGNNGDKNAYNAAKGVSEAEQIAYKDDQIAEENFYPDRLPLGRQTVGDLEPNVTQEVAAALTLQRSLQAEDGQDDYENSFNKQGRQAGQVGQTANTKTGLEKLMRSTPYKIKMHRPVHSASPHTVSLHRQSPQDAENNPDTYIKQSADLRDGTDTSNIGDKQGIAAAQQRERSPASMEHMFVMNQASVTQAAKYTGVQPPQIGKQPEYYDSNTENKQKAVQAGTYTLRHPQQNFQQGSQQNMREAPQKNWHQMQPQAHDWQQAKTREDFFKEQRQMLADVQSNFVDGRMADYTDGQDANYAADFGANFGAGISAGTNFDSAFGAGITGVFATTSYSGMISPDDGTGAGVQGSFVDVIQRQVESGANITNINTEGTNASGRDDKRSLRAGRHSQTSGGTAGGASGGSTDGERAPKIKQDNQIKARQSTFFEQNGEEIEKLFSGPREKDLEQLLPGSKWVRIDYDDTGKYYVIGIIGKDYLCYGVPASFTPDPPDELKGYCWWLPLDSQKPEGKGYWIMYQNLKTGEAIFPV